MIINVLAILMSLVVVFGLGVALHAWFNFSLRHFHNLAAQDVLTQWDFQLAAMPENAQHQRAHSPVEVLQAMLDLPSRQPWQLQLAVCTDTFLTPVSFDGFRR